MYEYKGYCCKGRMIGYWIQRLLLKQPGNLRREHPIKLIVQQWSIVLSVLLLLLWIVLSLSLLWLLCITFSMHIMINTIIIVSIASWERHLRLIIIQYILIILRHARRDVGREQAGLAQPCVGIHTYVYTYIYIYIYVHICIHIYIYIYIYVWASHSSVIRAWAQVAEALSSSPDDGQRAELKSWVG